MKTKEISFDTIQKIKANNKLAESLQTIEKIVGEMYWNDLQLQELNIDQFKKDIADYENDFDDLNSSNFIYMIMQFCEINQRLLTEQSKELVK